MKRNYTIPIFIPEKACPFRCIYCNQQEAHRTGASASPADVAARERCGECLTT